MAPTTPPAFSSSQPPAQPGFAPVQQGYAPAPPVIPPGGSPPVAQSGGGGSSAVKIILIIVAIIVFIVILIVGILGYIGYRAVHAVREAAHGNSTITIPGSTGGSFSVNSNKTYSAEELGTDIYPGATPIKGSMKLAMPTGTFLTGVFSTPDSRDQVVAFYKSKFSSDSGLMESDDATVLTLKKNDKETVMVTVTNKANENDGRTKIAILHTTAK
jgi:hypothetical protein